MCMCKFVCIPPIYIIYMYIYCFVSHKIKSKLDFIGALPVYANTNTQTQRISRNPMRLSAGSVWFCWFRFCRRLSGWLAALVTFPSSN